MIPIRLAALLSVVVFAPLVGAVLNGLLARLLPRRVVTAIGVGGPFVSFTASLLVLDGFLRLRAVAPESAEVTTTLFSWISAGAIQADFSLYLDALSMLMTLIVSGIGAFIHLYSVGYMHDDPSYARYFSHLNLFLFSMLLLVLGRSLLLVFVGWEGVGLCSYLLIGFWFDDGVKAAAGLKAFLVNRVGDLGFLLALFVLVFLLGGSLDVPVLRDAVTAPDSRIASDSGLVTLITLGLFLGVTGKSAQIPLYVWLPDAMAGPTPVSALIHAATMVTAGVYLVARLNFLFACAPVTMAVVASVGSLTAVLAASAALVQTDIKKVLAYSTVSQLGFMVLGVGVGAFGAGIFHLLTHAFFKACLFLGAGAVIHALHGEQDLRRIAGQGRLLPVTRWTFWVATLAIAGVPGFSGFFSKDEILFRTLTLSPATSVLPGWMPVLWFGLALVAAFLTALYMFRLYFLAFVGDPTPKAGALHRPGLSMTLPLVVLAIGSAVSGWLGIPGFHVLGSWLAPVFAPSAARFVDSGSHGVEAAVMAVSTLVALVGIGLAWQFYRGAGSRAPGRIAAAMPRVHGLLWDGWRLDSVYDCLVVRPLRAVAAFVFRWLDAGLVDGVLVMGSGRAWAGLGSGLRKLVTGDVQAYAAILVLALAAAVAWVF